MKKIVVPIINAGIGDFIMTLPMLENISYNNDIKVILIFNKGIYETIFNKTTFLKDNFKVIKEKNINSIRFWLSMRKQSSIILSPSVGIKPVLLWNALFFRIYSKSYIMDNRFRNLGIRAVKPQEHYVMNNIRILKKFYQENPGVSKRTETFYPQLRLSEQPEQEKIIYIHPGFEGNSKLKDTKDRGSENWTELINKLLSELSEYKIGIIIGPGYEEKFYDIFQEEFKSNNRIFFLYKLDLEELMKELKKGRLLINNDSGIGHLGGALGLQTLTIFGPADEKQIGVYSPYSDYIRAEGSEPIYEQGIWTKDFSYNRIKSLKPKVLFGKAKQLLGKK